MGVLKLTIARVSNEEPPLRSPSKDTASDSDADGGEIWAEPQAFHRPTARADSIDVQKDRPFTDDESHEEDPPIRNASVPRRGGPVAPPDEADAAGGPAEREASPTIEGRVIAEEGGPPAETIQDAAAAAADGDDEPRAAASTAAATRAPTRKPRRYVQWGEVHVRDYGMTLGDHPCCSYGPPVGLSWDYEEYSPVDVDEYEFHHPPRRNLREMQLNYYARKHLLELAGVSKEEWKKRAKEVGCAQRKRTVTRAVAKHYPLMKAEDAVESACRKFKRLLK